MGPFCAKPLHSAGKENGFAILMFKKKKKLPLVSLKEMVRVRFIAVTDVAFDWPKKKFMTGYNPSHNVQRV